MSVDVDENGEDDCNDREQRRGDEHDRETNDRAENGQRPVVVFVARSPVRRVHQRLESACEVNEGVTDEKEPMNDDSKRLSSFESHQLESWLNEANLH